MVEISQLQRNIISNRLPEDKRTPEIIEEYFINKLKLDQDLDKLADIDKAAALLEKHLIKHSHIVIIGDRDADGICATAIVYKSLIDIFKKSEEHIDVIINPRKEENGVSNYCVNQLLEINAIKPVDLVITVDHGSRDEVRYRIIKEKIPGIDLLVTDHHTVEYTDYPESADVFINPQRTDSTYSKDISGCQTGLCVLLATFKKMYPDESLSAFFKVLPYAAITVISDVMSLASPFNRYVVKTGLHEMNKYTNPVWLACKKILELPGNISTKDIGYKLSPLINTANRVHKEMLGFNFITSNTLEDALKYGKELAELNNIRKTVTRTNVIKANKDFDPTLFPNSVVSLIDSEYAINGLVASQLGYKYKKPSICFMNHPHMLNGSCRGIVNGFNILNVLTNIKNDNPGIISKLGGHAGSCGCTIKADELPNFKHLFDKYAGKELSTLDTKEELIVDAEINKDEITPALALAVDECGPYGKDWREPCFKTRLEVIRAIIKGPYVSFHFKNGIEGGCFIDDLPVDTSLFTRDTMVDVYYSIGMQSLRGAYNYELVIRDIKII